MIDLYCERLGLGLWAEPVNTFTNLIFLIAAFVAWRQAVQHQSLSSGHCLLIGLMAAIGIGSGLFHAYATKLALILDILPILFFQVAYLWIYGKRIIKLHSTTLAGMVVLYIIAAYFGRQFPHILNGSLIYAPAFMLILLLGVYHYRHVEKERGILLWAAVVFLISLFLRSIDHSVCAYITTGTHFFWHLLNGLLVYMVFRGLLKNTTTIQRGEDRASR